MIGWTAFSVYVASFKPFSPPQPRQHRNINRKYRAGNPIFMLKAWRWVRFASTKKALKVKGSALHSMKWRCYSLPSHVDLIGWCFVRGWVQMTRRPYENDLQFTCDTQTTICVLTWGRRGGGGTKLKLTIWGKSPDETGDKRGWHLYVTSIQWGLWGSIHWGKKANKRNKNVLISVPDTV